MGAVQAEVWHHVKCSPHAQLALIESKELFLHMVRLLREGLRWLCVWEIACDRWLGGDRTAARRLPCHL